MTIKALVFGIWGTKLSDIKFLQSKHQAWSSENSANLLTGKDSMWQTPGILIYRLLRKCHLSCTFSLYQESHKLASKGWKRLRCGPALWYWPDGNDTATGIEPKEKEICRELQRGKCIWQQDKSSLPDIIHGDPSFPLLILSLHMHRMTEYIIHGN